MIVLILRDSSDKVSLDVHTAVLKMLKLGDFAEGARNFPPVRFVEPLCRRLLASHCLEFYIFKLTQFGVGTGGE